MTFDALGLSPSLCQPLARLGYAAPTPIQAEAIPVALTGRDVIARAQTGTGKTAAFGLPMIDRLFLRGGRPGGGARMPRGLVLVPTRELARQVHDSLVTYGAPARVRVVAIYGGVPMGPQIQALRRGVEVVVATPGRLIDHLQQRTILLSGVEIVTLDEADRMLDLGFLPPLRRILASLPRVRQTLLLSATLPAAVTSLAAEFTRDPVRVDVSAGDVVPATVAHRIHPVEQDRKRDLLTHLLTGPHGGQALVFCRTKQGSNRVGRHLLGAGVPATVIHGNKSQNARTRALADFKAGRVRVLVATDLAARGLDIQELPLVVNYDLPLVAEDYVHRVGRTGRAGLAGEAVSLVSGAEKGLLRDIQRLLPEPLEHVAVAGFESRGLAPAGAAATAQRPAGRPVNGGFAGGRPVRRFRTSSGGDHPRHAGASPFRGRPGHGARRASGRP